MSDEQAPEPVDLEVDDGTLGSDAEDVDDED
jgi:hypothetical protein